MVESEMPDELHIEQVDRHVIEGLRDRILTPGHPGRPVVWKYDEDPYVPVHYAMFGRRQLIGCLSVVADKRDRNDPDDSYRLHSMAVETSWQRKGVGRSLLGQAAQDLVGWGAELLWATARPSAEAFYVQHLGFSRGKPFFVKEAAFWCRYVTLDRHGMERIASPA